MSLPPDSRLREALPYGLVVAGILVLGWFVFQPAKTGTVLLDDMANLGRLATATDADAALQFVFSGNAGPTGRPLALASFLPQAEAWATSRQSVIVVNILIHLFNGLLVYGFFRRLARARKTAPPGDRLVALAGLALWLFLPLLASSPLMIIQRMTTLAATFMLLGLNAYLYWRHRLDTKPLPSLVGMSAALIIATVLAVLAKENGALLPSLVLVIELTLLGQPERLAPARWRAWQAAFLGVPTAIVALLLLRQLPYADTTVLQRDFTGWERLMTQARVLFDYLLNAAVPRPWNLGPFHDAYPVARSIAEPLTAISIAAWIGLVASAAWWRRRFPVAAFGILWFVVAHLLESTTVPLYLYFEHRNYVPILGPAFAIAYLLFTVPGRYRSVIRVAFALFVAINIGITFQFASLWGKPLPFARYLHQNEPKSPGAAGFLAEQQMAYVNVETGLKTLDDFATANPSHAYLVLPALTVTCKLQPERDNHSKVEFLAAALPSIAYSVTVGSQLDELLNAASDVRCNGVDSSTIKRLADAVRSNPRYRDDERFGSFYHQLLAKLAYNDGDASEAIHQLETARSIVYHDHLDVMIVSLLVAEQQFDDAREYLRVARAELPRHVFRRIARHAMLGELDRYVEEAAASRP